MFNFDFIESQYDEKFICSIVTFIVAGMESTSSKAIYIEINAKIEKYSKIFNYAFLKVTMPVSIIPYVVKSYWVYYNTIDDGIEAFILPFLQWSISNIFFLNFFYWNK